MNLVIPIGLDLRVRRCSLGDGIVALGGRHRLTFGTRWPSASLA